MRRALRYAGFAIVGLIALVGLLLVLLATPPGRAILAGIVERAASTNGLTVSIGSLTGWPPFAFGADKIVASDAKGVFAEIDGLEIDLDVGALLTANIAFDAIGADRISFVRTPELEGGDTTVVADESDSGGGGLFPISVDRLAVARLELGEALIGHPAALAVDGAFALRADGGIHADLKANRLDNAVGSLWLAYQPIIEPRTGAIFGLEGLMRSDEPTMRGPDAVLDAAHRTGRIGDVGRQVRALAAAGLARRDSPAALFINLHPDELLADDLVGDGPLAGHAARIVLEITERASLPSSALLSRRIAELRALGFRIAIDDIGAGYSGLTTFADLAPEIVKIDMALVRNVHDAPIKRRTIRSLCELCHDMGSLVVAEGVEVGEERDVLLDLGCDLLQGFLFGRPERLVS